MHAYENNANCFVLSQDGETALDKLQQLGNQQQGCERVIQVLTEAQKKVHVRVCCMINCLEMVLMIRECGQMLSLSLVLITMHKTYWNTAIL